MRADYHFHTDRSYDSRASPEEVLEAAARAGLDVLCVTDHDTIEGALRLERIARGRVEIVVGCEFTCADRSHVVGLHLTDMIGEKEPLALMEKIRLQGGRVLLPHPFRRGSGLLRRELRRSEAFVREVLSRVDLVECFNGRDTYENNARSRRFAEAHGLASVASSDAHEAREIGSVFVEYPAGSPAHGRSPRRIFFPTQPTSLEHPLKRRAMELYHRWERRLPAAVGRAYRLARARARRDAPRWADPVPRMQYELPPLPGGSAWR